MKDKKKKIILIIGIISVILLVSGITYSWFKWRSSDNANVRIVIDNTSGLEITFVGGDNITGTLEPTLAKEEGIVKNFSANTNGLRVPMKLWLKINSLDNNLKDSTFKWELYKDSNILFSGDFSTESIASKTNNEETDYYLGIDSINGTTSNYTLYLWIDGNIDNNSNMASKSFNFDLYGTVSTTDVYNLRASTYISNLYEDASKVTATVNEVTYNLAPSVGLMNDRHASMDTDINGGDIRYYGANPNNYVWLGDTYTSKYTFTSKGSSVTRNVGDKKLWRVIGVFDGRVKLISNDPISSTGLSWDTSENNTTGGNYGYGINQWGESTYSDTGEVYLGADLMRLLNPGFESTTYNNSLYWNKGTGTVYTGRSNATTSDVSFVNTGLSNTEQIMIDTATWYLGAYNGNASYVNVQYLAERQSSTLGKICSSGNNCNDTVVRIANWDGKVGLMYPSDYGFATDLTICSQTLYNYSNSADSYACRAKDWLFDSSKYQWTLSPHGASDYARNVFDMYNDGTLSSGGASLGYAVRPAIYLKSDVVITGGNGSEDNPYVLELS